MKSTLLGFAGPPFDLSFTAHYRSLALDKFFKIFNLILGNEK